MKKFLKAIISLFFILFCLGQLQRINLGSGLSIYLHDIAIAIFFIFYSIHKITQKLIFRKELAIFFSSLSQNKLEVAFLILIVIGLAMHLPNQDLIIRPFFYLLRLTSYIIFSCLISREIVRVFSNRSMSLINAYSASGLLILGWGLLQFFLLPDTRFISILGWDDHYYRLISTQLDPAFAGMILVLTFAFIFTYIFRQKKNNYFFYLLLISLMYGILFTFSRATYLSFYFLLTSSLFMTFSQSNKRKLLLFILFFFTLNIIFIPKNTGEGNNLLRTSTIASRIDSDSSYFEFDTPKKLVLGNGIFVKNGKSSTSYNSNSSNHAQIPDNIFTTVFTGTGVIGLMLFMALITKWGRQIYRISPQYFLIAMTVFIHSQFNNTLLHPFVFLMWFGGLMDVMRKNDDKIKSVLK